jgi:hypothetical protein
MEASGAGRVSIGSRASADLFVTGLVCRPALLIPVRRDVSIQLHVSAEENLVETASRRPPKLGSTYTDRHVRKGFFDISSSFLRPRRLRRQRIVVEYDRERRGYRRGKRRLRCRLGRIERRWWRR